MAGLADGLAMAALALSFVLLALRRTRAIVLAVAWQGGLTAAAALGQGTDAALWLAAVLTLAANAVALPLGLLRAATWLGVPREAARALGLVPTIGLAMGLVALSLATAMPVPAAGPAQPGLAVALAVVLLGLLAMVARRDALVQLAGLLSAGNGIVLAAADLPGVTLAFSALVGAMVAGLCAAPLCAAPLCAARVRPE